METMETPQNTGIMAKLRNRKGFSLIEIAIVLVIIGIIIAAIIKGQDLMINSRAKQLVTTANAWKIAALGYMDRNGKMPGDTGTGVIPAAAPTGIDSIANTMGQTPQNPVTIGSNNFYFYLTSAAGSGGIVKNVMIVCTNATCSQALTADEVEMMKVLDTSIDGSAAADAGDVRSLTSVTSVTAGSPVNGRATAGVATLNAIGGSATWLPANFGAVWYFDKPY